MATVVAVLPLAAARVSRLSLQNHLALAVRRDGRGTIEQLATLLNVVFVAYFLCDCRPDDITPYTDAEAALNRCTRRAECGEPLAPDAGELHCSNVQSPFTMHNLPRRPRTAI